MNENILITGSTGFVGKSLLKYLIKDSSKKFYCLVRENKYNYPEYLNVTYFQISDLSKYIKDCDYVIHMAASLDSKARDITDVNVSLTEKILKECNKEKIKKFVYLSSTTVTRSDGLNYQKTKLEGERIVSESGLKYLIIRSPWILGKESRSVKNFINYLQKYPVVPVIGPGKVYTQPVYIDDLVNIMEKLILSEEEGKIISVGGKSPVTYNEFINYFMQKLDLKKPVIHLPLFLCKLIAKYSGILSLDAVSDFSNDTKIDISYLEEKYQYNPLDYRSIIDIITNVL